MLITYGIAFIYLERREQVEPAVTELHSYLIEQLFISDSSKFYRYFQEQSRSGATIVGG